jgi:hypothetical protein
LFAPNLLRIDEIYVDGNNAGTIQCVGKVSFHSGLSLAQIGNFAGAPTYQGILSVEFYSLPLSRPEVSVGMTKSKTYPIKSACNSK